MTIIDSEKANELILQTAKKSGVDVIIHCAFNPRSDFFPAHLRFQAATTRP